MKKILLIAICFALVSTQISYGLFSNTTSEKNGTSRKATKMRKSCHKKGLNYYSTPANPVGQCLAKGTVGATRGASRGGYVGGVY